MLNTCMYLHCTVCLELLTSNVFFGPEMNYVYGTKCIIVYMYIVYVCVGGKAMTYKIMFSKTSAE